MLVLSSLVFTTNAYGQCSLKGATQAGQQITHCIDNTNTVTTPNLNAGQYAVVNVVKGFSYTFSSDLYFGIYYTNLTLYNESNDTLLGFDRAWWPSYPSITWTANFSGKVKVLLSKGQDCYNDGSPGGPITVKLNTIGNTQDAQDSFGTDQWIGHVFNWTGNSPGGTTSPTNPFTASNYVGYYNVSTEAISEGFGGSDVCFPVLSAGVNRVNIYTDKFAVRYRMRSTKTGYYRLNIAGDDGVRVYVDNTLVINGWKDQGETAYCQLVYLRGNSDIVFDYYENGGGNVAKFNMSAANVLEGADKRFACSGISPGTLVGNEYTPCVASNSLYQWQSSSDNITFSDISGATSKDYQVPAITTLAINTRYFRRILKQTVANSTSPVVSNVITVITNPTPTLSGASSLPQVCVGSSLPTITHSTTGISSIGTPINLPTGVNATYSNNKIEITGTPTVSGTFNYKIPIGTDCNDKTIFAEGKITVNPNNTIVLTSASGTNSQTACIATPITSITYNTTGATGATVSGLPNGVTGTWSSNVLTISGTPTASGSFPYTVTLSGGCGSETISGYIFVNELPIATVAYVNQYVCKDENAEFTITGPVSAQVSYSLNGIAKTGVISSSGTLNISVLNAESDQTLQLISINNGTCTVSLSNSATVKVGADAVFNGTTWSPALPYDNGLNAVINNDYNTNTSGSIKACNCTVNSGKSLTIAKDTYVEIKNTLINNGRVTVEMDGNLIQRNNFPKVPNAGEITVQKLFTFKPKSSEPDRQQYNYISSPVMGGYVNRIFPGSATTAIYHSEARNMFYSSSGFNIQGRALAVKEPSRTDVPGNTATANFVGMPFSGILKYPVAYTVNAGVTPGHNLLGNPYPSNLDLDKLYNYSDGENTNSEVIESTFRFWDNRYNTLYKQMGSLYTGDSYAKYNSMSGTGVPAATAPNSTADPRVPDGNLTIGTGFMVRALPTANGKSVVFENSMRTAGRGKTFYGRAIPKDRYWLSLKTPANMQLINAVVYLENGSNAVGAEDTSFSSSSDGIFTVAENRGLSIQGRSSFNKEDKVDLGLSVFAAGEYTISLFNFEGIFADNQHIYLNDKEAGIITDLTEGSYTFNAKSSGLSTGRFEIVYKVAATLATVNVVKTDVKIYLAENGYLIKAPNRITKLEVYEMTGRLIQSFKPNSVDYMLNSDEFSNGVYLLKIEQGDTITVKKIIK